MEYFNVIKKLPSPNGEVRFTQFSEENNNRFVLKQVHHFRNSSYFCSPCTRLHNLGQREACSARAPRRDFRPIYVSAFLFSSGRQESTNTAVCRSRITISSMGVVRIVLGQNEENGIVTVQVRIC